LITEGKVIGIDVVIFCQRHEVGADSAFGPLMQGDGLRAGIGELANDVGGAVR